MNRQEINRELLLILTKLIEEEPQLRFNQILYSYGFNDNYYTEPDVVLSRVKRTIKEYEEQKEKREQVKS